MQTDATVALLVGTRRGAFLLESDGRRGSWEIRGPAFAGWKVHHLTRDPRDGALYASVEQDLRGLSRLMCSEDMGRTWQELEGPRLPAGGAPRVWRIAAGHPARPGELWAGVEPAGLFRSADGGRSWEPVHGLNEHPSRASWVSGGGGLMLHSIIPHPEDPERLYAGISIAGVLRSDDGGATWALKNCGVPPWYEPGAQGGWEAGVCVHALALVAGAPDTLYQQNHLGVFRSEDGGETWQEAHEGLPTRFGFPIAAEPPRTLYVVPEGAEDMRFTPGGAFAIYRSRDGGRSWERLTRGLPGRHAYLNVLRGALATDGLSPGGVYAGTSTGQLFASRDEGESWELVAQFLPPIASVEAVVLSTAS